MKDNVLRGIELLDRQVPGWREKIDWNELSMGHCKKCILGQLFGHFDKGVRKLAIKTPSPFGFNTVGSYVALTELWREEE